MVAGERGSSVGGVASDSASGTSNQVTRVPTVVSGVEGGMGPDSCQSVNQLIVGLGD